MSPEQADEARKALGLAESEVETLLLLARRGDEQAVAVLREWDTFTNNASLDIMMALRSAGGSR